MSDNYDKVLQRAAELEERDNDNRSLRDAYGTTAGVTDARIAQARTSLAEEKRKSARNKWIAFGAVGVIILMLGGTYNGLNNSYRDVQGAQRQVVNVVQRSDALLPALDAVIAGANAQEIEVLQQYRDIVQALGDGANSDPATYMATINTFGGIQGQLTQTVTGLQNNAGTSVNDLRVRQMDEIAGSINRISQETRKFNEQITDFNKDVTGFPTNFVSGFMGFEEIVLGDVDISVGFGE